MKREDLQKAEEYYLEEIGNLDWETLRYSDAEELQDALVVLVEAAAQAFGAEDMCAVASPYDRTVTGIVVVNGRPYRITTQWSKGEDFRGPLKRLVSELARKVNGAASSG